MGVSKWKMPEFQKLRSGVRGLGLGECLRNLGFRNLGFRGLGFRGSLCFVDHVALDSRFFFFFGGGG